jgi:thiamine-monophosphate kinase
MKFVIHAATFSQRLHSFKDFETFLARRHMSEFKIIETIKTQLGPASSRVLVGIGDDAAVLASANSSSDLPSVSKKMLFCSDLMVEGVHFDLTTITPSELGHKSLAVCLSDIAAMNGAPVAATISIALPSRLSPDFVDEFYKGVAALAKSVHIDCVGGDLSASPSSLFINVACVGETVRPLLRSGAKAGDVLAVSGTPGASAAGLHALKSRGHVPDSLRQKHLQPMPRFDLLKNLSSCHALIDISDGLASETHHLAKASQVGFVLEAAKIPLHPDALNLVAGELALEWALYGGEDYELLATFSPEIPVPNGFTVIGRATESLDVLLQSKDGALIALEARGYDHFRR